MRCKAELSSWGDLANLIEKQNFFVTGQPAKDAPPPLTEISLFTLQMYLRAGLRDYPHWEALRGSVEHWQQSGGGGVLVQHYCFELAQIALTDVELDRSLYYKSMEVGNLLSAWSNMSRLSNHAKHKLVQRIQRLYELGDFLTLAKRSGLRQQDTSLAASIIKSERAWLSRAPSITFDTLEVWDDVVTGRLMYKRLLEKMGERFGGLEAGEAAH